MIALIKIFYAHEKVKLISIACLLYFGVIDVGKSYLDLLWDIKEEVEDKLEAEGALCDHVESPTTLMGPIGWKCIKGKVGFEISNGRCNIFVRGVTQDELEELEEASGLDLLTVVTPYEPGKPRRQWVGGEVQIPCDREMIIRYFTRLSDLVSRK